MLPSELYARLEYPGGAIEFDEILAFYKLEEEDRKARQQREDIQRQVDEISRRTGAARNTWGGKG